MEEALAKINRLKRDGGVGYTNKHTAILSPFVNGDADIVAFGYHFWRQSPKTFTKAEIEAGRIVLGFREGDRELWTGMTPSVDTVQVLFDNNVGYAFAHSTDLNFTHNGYVIFAAYQSGDHALTVQGNTMTVSIPKEGLYIGFPAEVVPELPDKNSTSTVEMFRCEWEHVSAIDQKYLPGPVVIDLPIDKDTLFSGANIPVDEQMVETLEKAAINHSTVYVQITGGSTMVLPFNLAVVQSGQDYKYYTFCCVSVDMSTVSYSAFMINLHTGDKTISGKATSIKGIFA